MLGFDMAAAGQTGLTAGRDISSSAAESHHSHHGGLLDGFNVAPSQLMHDFPEVVSNPFSPRTTHFTPASPAFGQKPAPLLAGGLLSNTCRGSCRAPQHSHMA